MKIKVQLKHLRIAPRKVRLVSDLVKKKTVTQADVQLRHLPNRAGEPILKLIHSGAANAKHNFGIEKEELVVKELFVNQGSVLKRVFPKAFGRATPIRKQSSHVTLVLETKPKMIKEKKSSKKSK